MSTKIHYAAFERYASRESWDGPGVYEIYEPFCGSRPEDPRLTHESFEVTCGNCRRRLGMDSREED